MSVKIIENKDDFTASLKDAGCKLVVVDFFADWCGPCRMIGPVIQELASEHDNVVFLKVNVDENGELAGEYGVNGIPHFAFFKNEKKLEEFSGANKDKLRQTIEKLK